LTFPKFLESAWRLARVGGTAAVLAAEAASHVSGHTTKGVIIAGGTAAVETLYRILVPAQENTKLQAYWSAIVKVAKADGPIVETLAKQNPETAKLAAALQADANSLAAAQASATGAQFPVA
jgi:hypothetical protein